MDDTTKADLLGLIDYLAEDNAIWLPEATEWLARCIDYLTKQIGE